MISETNYLQLKDSATRKLHYAINTGKFPKLKKTDKCKKCGKPATKYGHINYKKPFDVIPLCGHCTRSHKVKPAYERKTLSKKQVETKDSDDSIFYLPFTLNTNFNEKSYDDRIDDLRYIDCELDYVIAMNELCRHPKKYRNFKYTKRGKKMVETKLEHKQFLESLLNYELAHETLD